METHAMKKQKDKFFDEMLKHAAANHVEELAVEASKNEELVANYIFSQRHEENMSRLFLKQRKRERCIHMRRTAIKMATVTMVFFIISIITVMIQWGE